VSTTLTVTATTTVTPTVSEGPLSLSYALIWTIDPNDPAEAIASVVLTASGGGGEYRFYRDEQPVDGPEFTYRWAACRANPGSFRVDSADGQSVRIDYYETPPCP
jgi:hypothetical protein